ncbi:hypothetical protein [Arenimonas aestuarii]
MPEYRTATRFAALLTLLLSLAWLAPVALAADDASRVWVNTNSGVYHCPGTQYYGNTKRGKYLSESEATESGYRAAYGKRYSPAAARTGQSAAKQGLIAEPQARSTEVWVNTSSGVYHCPGTRYYGATKRGRYMSEADAVAVGNRPAYGARCSR